MQFVESRSLGYSLLLHLALLLMVAVGLPILLPKPPDPEPLVMSVEIMPISEMTNVKPSDKEIQEEKHAPEPKPVKAPTPPPAPEKPHEKTPPAPAPDKAEVPTEKHFDPMEGDEPAPEEKPKPVEKPKPAEPPKPKNDDFAALLNKLNQENKPAPPKPAKDTTNTEENKTKSNAPYDPNLPLSMSEKDAIRSQFKVCWTPPMGAKDAHALVPRIKVTLQADGTVLTAVLASDQQGRYNSDSFFRAAADSALRAVHRCSPLKNLPTDKYNSWREMEMTFDPADM